jgi:hypothetical protein
MGTEENKAVVRRFMNELLIEGNLDVADEVLAPDYVNFALGGGDAVAAKAMVSAMDAAQIGQRYEDEELVAEGDVVTARFKYILTLPPRRQHGRGAGSRLLPSRRRSDRRQRCDV